MIDACMALKRAVSSANDGVSFDGNGMQALLLVALAGNDTWHVFCKRCK